VTIRTSSGIWRSKWRAFDLLETPNADSEAEGRGLPVFRRFPKLGVFHWSIAISPCTYSFMANLTAIGQEETYVMGAMIGARKLAREIGVSERTMRRYIRQGLIKAVKVGNKWLVPSEEAERVRRATSLARTRATQDIPSPNDERAGGNRKELKE